MTDSEIKKHGWTAPILFAIAALLFVALLIVPGYIAGYYCRLAPDMNSLIAIDLEYGEGAPATGPSIGLKIFLAPSRFAARIAPPLGEFYKNQFYYAAHIYTGPFVAP